jgi:hypothetical protein
MPDEDRSVISVHMTASHFERYREWLKRFGLEAVPLPDVLGGGENEYFVGIRGDHPGLSSSLPH